MRAFTIFGMTWLEQLLTFMDVLYLVPKPLSPDKNQVTIDLINMVMSHYGDYYTMKAVATSHDVLAVFTAPWATPFEQSLQWLAGWHPTAMFNLLLLETITIEDNGYPQKKQDRRWTELSSEQWEEVSMLQCEDIREEREISEEMSEWQMDSALEFLGHEVDVDGKLKTLVQIVKKADNLSFKTLMNAMLLTPADCGVHDCCC